MHTHFLIMNLLLRELYKFEILFLNASTHLIIGQFSTMIQTPASLLRQQFMNVQSLSPNHNDDQYIEKLKEHGLNYHPALFPSFFKLKNGLLYPGMATHSDIGAKQVLVEVPQNLILSSIKALKQPHLVDVFSESFYQDETSWEDRVLITYLLYIYSQQDQNSIFYQMLKHMSKDIDICCFWDPSEWELFQDQTIKSTAINDLKAFEEQWDAFSLVQQKYEVLQHSEITKDNYRWIFVHISSRCFGKYIDYTSFVPFCEFFNHHASSVAYEVNNKKQPSEKTEQPEQNKDDISSNGSDDSADYLREGQFDYHEIEPISLVWGSKQCYKLDPKQKKVISSRAKELIKMLQEELDWKDFSVLFIGKMIQRIKIIENQFIAGRKTFKTTDEKLEEVQKMKDKYVNYIRAMYKTIKHKSFIYNKRDNNSEKKKFVRPNPFEYQPSFSKFSLKTHERDNFLSNHEVYFCYGRNSNRTLLMRYGFAIQGNKYEHVWLSYDISLPLKYMPDLLKMVQEKGLSLRRNYKIKPTSLNMELIIFHRLCNWNLYNIRSLDEIFYVMSIEKQLETIGEVKESLKSEVLVYADSNDLSDEKIGYHEYFARVYHIEKVRILNQQIEWIQIIENVLLRVGKGQSVEQATEDISETNKYVLKNYFDCIVI